MFKLRNFLFLSISFFLIQFFLFHTNILAENTKVFRTNHTSIFYSADKDLGDFLWRISGKRFDFAVESRLAKSRVDGIIDRVQGILDMYPDRLHIRVDLYPQYKEGMIALYSHKNRTIIVYVDKVTDGVFAHEVAHAVICNYFPEPPPQKIQEILAQYVDRHLWTEY